MSHHHAKLLAAIRILEGVTRRPEHIKPVSRVGTLIHLQVEPVTGAEVESVIFGIKNITHTLIGIRLEKALSGQGAQKLAGIYGFLKLFNRFVDYLRLRVDFGQPPAFLLFHTEPDLVAWINQIGVGDIEVSLPDFQPFMGVLKKVVGNIP